MNFFHDTYIIFRKNLKQYLRWKLHLVFDIVFPLLDLILFILVWRAILSGGFKEIGYLNPKNYVAYLLSGLLLWRFVDTALSGEVTHSFIREKYWRTSPYLLISPINRLAIPYGMCLLSLIRAVYSGFILLFVGILFFNFSSQGNLLLALLVIFLTFLGFSGIGLIIAGLASWREDFADLTYVINYVLMIASGVFFPLEILPESFRNGLLLLPSSQAVNAIRAIVIRNAGIAEILPTLAYLALFSIISLGIAALIFKLVQRKAMLIGI